VDPDGPQQCGEGLCTLPCGAALFVREQERAVLLSSLTFDAAVLEWVSATWTGKRALLSRGELLVEGDGNCTRALAPIVDSGRLMDFFYLEAAPNARFVDERDRTALAQLTRIAALALSAPLTLPIAQAGIELFLERSSPDDIARTQLLVILDRHEWNIAQVARLLGVTRATIYNRLERLGIERRRVPKVHVPKRQPA
jgi:hypothetical protein